MTILNFKNRGMTICAKCVHADFRGEVWYDQFCRASRNERTTDPVTGKRSYKVMNDLGTVGYSDEPYRLCRDVNDGQCKNFEARCDDATRAEEVRGAGVKAQHLIEEIAGKDKIVEVVVNYVSKAEKPWVVQAFLAEDPAKIFTPRAKTTRHLTLQGALEAAAREEWAQDDRG